MADTEEQKPTDLTVIPTHQITLADIETYRANPDHRKFVDEVLGPRIDVKKIWNFTIHATP